MEPDCQPNGLAHPVEEAPVSLRKLGAAIAVAALVTVSTIVGISPAYALPDTPVITPGSGDPWFTADVSPQILGTMGTGNDHIQVQVSHDNFASFSDFCAADPNPSSTDWACDGTPDLAYGTNQLRAIATASSDPTPESAPSQPSRPLS